MKAQKWNTGPTEGNLQLIVRRVNPVPRLLPWPSDITLRRDEWWYAPCHLSTKGHALCGNYADGDTALAQMLMVFVVAVVVQRKVAFWSVSVASVVS